MRGESENLGEIAVFKVGNSGLRDFVLNVGDSVARPKTFWHVLRAVGDASDSASSRKDVEFLPNVLLAAVPVVLRDNFGRRWGATIGGCVSDVLKSVGNSYVEGEAIVAVAMFLCRLDEKCSFEAGLRVGLAREGVGRRCGRGLLCLPLLCELIDASTEVVR